MKEISKYNPFASILDSQKKIYHSTFETLSKSIDEMFDRSFSSSMIDMEESDNNINYYIDLPGFKTENLNVSMNDSVVSIHAERKGYRASTIDTHFTISQSVEPESLNANLTDGVLTLSFTRKAKSSSKGETRKINVKSSQ
jgi:HSP20 family molecular chaperone IbpA